MNPETRRMLIRIVSNYTRLFIAVAAGLLVVPIVTTAIGGDAFGLYVLLVSAGSMTAIMDEIVRATMIRELGAAYHANEPLRGTPEDRFPSVYNSALLVSAGLCLVTTVLAVLAVVFLLPVLEMPDELHEAARIALIARVAQQLIRTLVAPAFNMYMITERMRSHNMWILLGRINWLIFAVILFKIIGMRDPSSGLIWFVVLSSGMMIVADLTASVLIALQDRRLIPDPRLFSLRAAGGFLRLAGMNMVTVIASNLHLRMDAIAMNVLHGTSGNSIFGMGVLLMSYARRLTIGMTDGLDAVSTRMTAGGKGGKRGARPEPDPEADRAGLLGEGKLDVEPDAVGVPGDSVADEGSSAGEVRGLLRQATRMNAMVALSSGLTISMLSGPIVGVWVRSTPSGLPDDWRERAATIIAILSVGIAARAIADGWTRILYGAGHIARYAPLLLIAGLLNVALAFGVGFVFSPERVEGEPLVPVPLDVATPGDLLGYYAPALAFSVSVLLLNFLGVAWVAGRVLGDGILGVLAPLWRPAVAAVVPAVVHVLALWLIDEWTLLLLLADLLVYGVLWFACVFAFAFSARERAAFVRLARKLSGRRGGPRPDAAQQA